MSGAAVLPLQSGQGLPSISPSPLQVPHLAMSGSAAFMAGDSFGFFFSGLGTPRSFARRAMSFLAAFTSPWPDRARVAAFSRSPAVSIG